MNPTCPICGGSMTSVIITRLGSMENVSLPAHLCPGPNVQVTMPVSDWNKSLQAMRNWHVTLQSGGKHTSVPDVFQEAFKDGELEL